MSVQLTKIEWCDLTVNFWEGCTKVSPGCANCYAEARDQRYHDGQHWGKGRPRKWVKAGPDKARAMNSISKAGTFCLDHETGKREPVAVELAGEKNPILGGRDEGTHYFRYEPVRPLAFCMSLGDFFDLEVGPDMRARALHTIAVSQHIDWMILTKRPESAMELLRQTLAALPAEDRWDAVASMLSNWLAGHPPMHVAIGSSAEDQLRLDERLPILNEIPATRRFLSCEPLLGPLNFMTTDPEVDLIITGGESGPKARPCHPGWIEDIHKQAATLGIDHHHKQWGEWVDTEIVAPPTGWKPEQGQAIWMQHDGTITGTGDRPEGARLLWRAGKAKAGSEMMELSTGRRKHSHPLLKFPLEASVPVA